MFKKLIPWSIIVNLNLKKKKQGQFSEVLGRTKTDGSHKKAENHPTLVITWAFDFLMTVIINVDTQIDTQ